MQIKKAANDQSFLKDVKTDVSLDDLPIDELTPAPDYDGAQFIRGALTATGKAVSRVRETVQSDIATVLNCQQEDISFMWAEVNDGAEVLDCEIPDFRDVQMNLKVSPLAAE